MQITITDDGIKVTDALRQHIDKFNRLDHILTKATSIHVTLSVENLEQVAKALVHAHGTEFYARAESTDLYTAIDDLIDKIEQQVNKHKQKQKEKRHDSSEKFNQDYTDEEL
ncbi:ribosome hibernation-promoting factor, HPF/YfiA family [Rickettsiella endosymbiont of Dermanyssus gallinae]|uniref:ribosome hibernation-promoting factor, HPF/YfiA family n=1 Tax=Rickettsiella endosymbiont of Dermanyssus gallinae TaxID=2856608 RepID=UPI001C533429|nr:ribosome-associated translation inhibitor RaiA [Rickettsiella endosymbiont of Dermanyssus gallinae]